MTQNLSGIEPVSGRGDDLSPDLSGRTSMAAPFASLPDPVAMERFLSAMADGGAEVGGMVPQEPPGMKDGVGGAFMTRERSERHGQLNAGCERALPEVRKSVRYSDCIAPQNQGEAAIRRSEGTLHGHDMTAQETESMDESYGQTVGVSEYAPRTVSLAQDPAAGSPSAKSVPTELTDVAGDDIRKAEVCAVNVGRAISPKSPEVKNGIVGAFVERALPEKGVTAGREVPVEPHSMIKSHEMPPDGHEPVQVISPAPLPIELPAASVRQESAVPVAVPDVVRMFVAAAEAVADAILVSSGFEKGEGRILVRLQPEVLGGSEVQITAKGGTLTVVVNPSSQDVQMIVEANRTQFEQHLAEKVHSWRVAVAVKRGDKTDERV